MKIALEIIFVLLISGFVGNLLVSVGQANPNTFWQAQPPTLTLLSPESEVYYQNSVPVIFNLTYIHHFPDVRVFWFEYYLDEDEGVFFSASENEPVVGRALLKGLDDGSHTLKVAAVVGLGYRSWGTYPATAYPITLVSSQRVSFSVDTAPPRINVLSVKSLEELNGTNVVLVFSVSESASWLGYSLDGEAPVAITGNTTISGLSEGTHTIVVEAEDSAGSVGESSPVSFTVETQGSGQPDGSQPAIFPTTLVIAIAASVVAISLGLLFYFRKHRHPESSLVQG